MDTKSSGGRKRRRRKGSQSEGKRVESPTPQSPNQMADIAYHPATNTPEPANQVTPTQQSLSNQITPQQSSNEMTPQRSSNEMTPQRSSNEMTPQLLSNEIAPRSSTRQPQQRGSRRKLITRFKDPGTAVWGRSLSSR